MARFTVLTDTEINKSLEQLPNWTYDAPNIKGEFRFPDFRTAIAYICVVGIEAEKMNHHPEFSNSYDKVSFSFCTHDADFQITDLDIKMAGVLSEAAKQLGALDD